jgi:hypothetical protein
MSLIRKTPSLLDLTDFGQRRRLALMFISSLALAGVLVGVAGLPIWGGTIGVLAALLLPLGLKFHDDLERWGLAVCVLGVLLALQAFHTLEHIVQLVQFYVFNNPGINSQGLISSLNVEWVHFIWNWTVWGILVFLFFRGMRTVWVYPLLLWVTLHSLEHTFMLLNYLHVLAELEAFDLPAFQAAQVLPGILGKDGWLAQNSLLCRAIPGLTTLPRVAIHFYWNIGEMTLLLLTAATALPKMVHPPHAKLVRPKGETL